MFSVGNLAAGGTGKTPVVRFLAELLKTHGEHPAVLMRGYRGDGDANDEARTIAECPVFCAADRVQSGHQAIAAGATCLLLDDGFQHRRLHRDLDLVLIDATRPWSGLLPVGYDREPRAALARADVIILTRGGLVDAAERGRIRACLTATGKPLMELSDGESWLSDLAGSGRQPLELLRGQPVLLASGLGNPCGFERSALGQAWHVLASWRYPDHYHFTARDASELTSAAQRLNATLVITAKDAVKLAPLLPTTAALVLHQRVDMAAADKAVLKAMVLSALARVSQG